MMKVGKKYTCRLGETWRCMKADVVGKGPHMQTIYLVMCCSARRHDTWVNGNGKYFLDGSITSDADLVKVAA
jgi:hypothetical protein